MKYPPLLMRSVSLIVGTVVRVIPPLTSILPKVDAREPAMVPAPRKLTVPEAPSDAVLPLLVNVFPAPIFTVYADDIVSEPPVYMVTLPVVAVLA